MDLLWLKKENIFDIFSFFSPFNVIFCSGLFYFIIIINIKSLLCIYIRRKNSIQQQQQQKEEEEEKKRKERKKEREKQQPYWGSVKFIFIDLLDLKM